MAVVASAFSFLTMAARRLYNSAFKQIADASHTSWVCPGQGKLYFPTHDEYKAEGFGWFWRMGAGEVGKGWRNQEVKMLLDVKGNKENTNESGGGRREKKDGNWWRIMGDSVWKRIRFLWKGKKSG